MGGLLGVGPFFLRRVFHPTPPLQRAGRAENIVGWYHSHPGYGCWLSGIDVGTQVCA